MIRVAAPQLSLRIHRKKSMAILFRWRVLLPAFKEAEVFTEVEPEGVNFLAQLLGNVFFEFAFVSNNCDNCAVIQLLAFTKKRNLELIGVLRQEMR